MLAWKKRLPKADPASKPREHATNSGWDLIYVARMIHELTEIHSDQVAVETRMKAELERIPAEHRASARNLLHYLSLRTRDIRGLQESLASIGLSSLGRAEGHILYNVQLLLKHLHHIIRHSWEVPPESRTVLTRRAARQLLESRANRTLGPRPETRCTRIMVTMSSEAATDYGIVRDLVAGGMNAMRINCAHDGPDAWKAMVDHLRRAEKEIGRRCSILMDLAGPKIRTGSLGPGPKVLKWKPGRDVYGRPKTPAKIWLTPAEAPEPPPSAAAAVLGVRGAWVAGLELGDEVQFRDARGSRRKLQIAGVHGTCRWATCDRTSYLDDSTRLTRVDAEGCRGESEPVGDLPCLEQSIVLKRGDQLLLTASPEPGRPAVRNERGEVTAPARISCTLAGALVDVKKGEPVRFDDGKIGGKVVETTPKGLLVEITRVGDKGAKLGADKGINFPESTLRVPSLTEKDIEDLAFVVRHADMVGYSFVRSPEDVRALVRRIKDLGGAQPGIILKIETQAAFSHLPALLLASLEAPSAGVMIARGDLAIECGYERLAELQEEILWLCEAAHLPVIWATQVLEQLAKDGQPSRAEITDAAMGERAECIMLNKGPHIVEAVRMLDDIVRRMEAHQSKKMSTFRPLRVASDALELLR
jgi:pyruvate kinase